MNITIEDEELSNDRKIWTLRNRKEEISKKGEETILRMNKKKWS